MPGDTKPENEPTSSGSSSSVSSSDSSSSPAGFTLKSKATKPQKWHVTCQASNQSPQSSVTFNLSNTVQRRTVLQLWCSWTSPETWQRWHRMDLRFARRPRKIGWPAWPLSQIPIQLWFATLQQAQKVCSKFKWQLKQLRKQLQGTCDHFQWESKGKSNYATGYKVHSKVQGTPQVR